MEDTGILITPPLNKIHSVFPFKLLQEYPGSISNSKHKRDSWKKLRLKSFWGWIHFSSGRQKDKETPCDPLFL